MTQADFDAECDAIRQKNDVLLEQFALWLSKGGLSEKTVVKHVENIGLYINAFLLYEEPKPPEKGVTEVGWFLGHWFIRKALWASATSIKGYAASFKKFYSFMLEQGRIDADALDGLKQEIKEEMPSWLENLRRFDSVDWDDFA